MIKNLVDVQLSFLDVDGELSVYLLGIERFIFAYQPDIICYRCLLIRYCSNKITIRT